jgi:hypothetical protein
VGQEVLEDGESLAVAPQVDGLTIAEELEVAEETRLHRCPPIGGRNLASFERFSVVGLLDGPPNGFGRSAASAEGPNHGAVDPA